MCKWIKASDRLPQREGGLHMKNKWGNNWWQWTSPKAIDKEYWIEHGYQWLDESPTPAINEGLEEMKDIIHKGIEFANGLRTESEAYKSGAGYGYSCGYQAALNKNNPDWKDNLATDFGYKNLSDMDTSDRSMIEESEKRLKHE